MPGRTPSGYWSDPFGTYARARVDGYTASAYRFWVYTDVMKYGTVDPPLGWVRGDDRYDRRRPTPINSGQALYRGAGSEPRWTGKPPGPGAIRVIERLRNSADLRNRRDNSLIRAQGGSPWSLEQVREHHGEGD